MPITPDDAKVIAQLSQLQDKDGLNMLEDFNRILHLFDQLNQLDTDDIVSQDTHTLCIETLRMDHACATPLCDQFETFAHYDSQSKLFEVPKVIEE